MTIIKDRRGINSFARFKKPEYWPRITNTETTGNVVDSPFGAYSLAFDGISGRLDMPILYKNTSFNHVNLRGTYYNQAITLAFWIKVDGSGVSRYIFIQTFNDESQLTLSWVEQS